MGVSDHDGDSVKQWAEYELNFLKTDRRQATMQTFQCRKSPMPIMRLCAAII